MIPKEFCECCGQSIAYKRLGVVLTPTQAAIFDVIERAGVDGIEPRDVHDIVYAGKRVTPQLVAVHVRQINDRLEETDWQIKCGRGRYANYRLYRKP